MDNSKDVLDFYVKANEKKYHIVDKKGQRSTSEAEQTILECIIALGLDSEYEIGFDVNKVIRMLFAKSLDDSVNMLENSEEYKQLFDEYKSNNTKDAYVANMCTKLSKDFTYETLNDKETFNLYNNYLKLRETVRQGHVYWGANSERLESILEHIYGTCVLVLGIESAYDYKLVYSEIIRMLLLHETEEIKIGDITAWDGVSPEEKINIGRKAVNDILGNLKKSEEYISLLEEFNKKMTLSSKYAYLCDKLEYDLQVKMYENMGKYDYDNVPKNVVTTSESVKNIMNNGADGVFDVHYQYDLPKYISTPCMRNILDEAKKLKK